MTIDDKVNALVETFVHDLQELVHEQITEAILSAVNAGRAPLKRSVTKEAPAKKSKAKRTTTKKRTTKKKKKVAKRKKKGGRTRRSPEEMAKTQADILKALKAGPARSEALAETIGVAVKELHTPLKKLVDEKQLKSKGTTRAKEYRLA